MSGFATLTSEAPPSMWLGSAQNLLAALANGLIDDEVILYDFAPESN